MGKTKQPGAVEPKAPAKKPRTLKEAVKVESQREPGTPVEEHSAPSSPASLNHKGNLKLMLGWLNYRADPEKNKSRELLADSQQALEASFLLMLCCLIVDNVVLLCFYTFARCTGSCQTTVPRTSLSRTS
jgi:hypothetical protein